MIKKVIKIEEFYKKNYNYIENIKKLCNFTTQTYKQKPDKVATGIKPCG